MTDKDLDAGAVPDALGALAEEGRPLRGERYVISRDGEEIAALVSLTDPWRLEQLDAERRTGRRNGILQLVGLFDDLPRDVVDEFVADVLSARERSRTAGSGA